jgi:N-formylglutamate deformylase
MKQTFFTLTPDAQKTLPLVFDSPHSGIEFPSGFVCLASTEQLKTGWDAFVDQLWESSVKYGATLQSAKYSRMYIDLNRAGDDIDPALIKTASPQCKPTKYSERGMGLIRRFALPNVPMYADLLDIDDINMRIHHYYQPYHNALKTTLDQLYDRFRKVWHVDCHSMKSVGNKMNVDSGSMRPDVILGDNDGLACDPDFVQTVETAFTKLGYKVVRNNPYKGGYLVTHYANPNAQRYSMQIEVNRALYMDEKNCTPNQNFSSFSRDISNVARELAIYVESQLQTDKQL